MYILNKNTDFEMETADVLMFIGKDKYPKVIQKLQTHPGEGITYFNHAEVSTGAYGIVGARGFDGVVCDTLHNYVKKDTDYIAIFRTNLTFTESHTIAVYAISLVGRKYGWGKLLLHGGDYLLSRVAKRDVYGFRRLARGGRYPICSWAVTYAYEQVRTSAFGVPVARAQPDDMSDYMFMVPEWQPVACSPEIVDLIKKHNNPGN